MLLLIVFTGGIAFGGLYLGARWGVFGSLPSKSELKAIDNHTSTEIYAFNGELLGKYYIYDRTHVSLDEISPFVTEALLATEDIRFYRHRGTDYRSMLRVFVKNILLRQPEAGGGSTITRQLVKNIYPRENGGTIGLVIEKLKEGIIAGRLEKVYNKDEILLLYLNTVPFGENVFGISAASQRFFNKTPMELSPQEAATLVGMLKATSSFNPRLHPARAESRRNTVIDQLSNYNFIEEAFADSLKSLPLELNYAPLTHLHGPAPYFREMLRLELRDWLEQYNEANKTDYSLYNDGLKIYTTLDYQLQLKAEKAVGKQMRQLQNLVDIHYRTAGRSRVEALVTNQVRRTKRYQALKASGISEKEIMAILNHPEEMTFFGWDQEKLMHISPIDSVFMAQKLLHSGLVAIEPATGFVKAWVGGNDFRFFQFDQVLSRRQAGSAFKPFVYAVALENGIEPCDFVSNGPVVFEEYGDWSPSNVNDHYEGYYSMQGALAHSVNTVSARYLSKAGIDKVIELARQAGIQGHLPEVPSLSLGTAETSLLELTAAYAIFANEGQPASPRWLLRVEDRDGKTLYRSPTNLPPPSVIKSETALLMNEMLKSAVDSGTARTLRDRYELSIDIAGKTGTTQYNSDGWFIGYTPDLITGVWVGLENPSFSRAYPLPFGASGSAVPLWGEFMQQVSRDPETMNYTSSRFRELPPHLAEMMACNMYIEELPRRSWFERIFGGRDEPPSREETKPEKEEEKPSRKKRRGFFRRILDEVF